MNISGVRRALIRPGQARRPHLDISEGPDRDE
jgi:hypothetical protein